MNSEQMKKILQAAQSPDAETRFAAAFALCFDHNHLISNTAFMALKKLTVDSDSDVKQAALSLMPYAEKSRSSH